MPVDEAVHDVFSGTAPLGSQLHQVQSAYCILPSLVLKSYLEVRILNILAFENVLKGKTQLRPRSFRAATGY